MAMVKKKGRGSDVSALGDVVSLVVEILCRVGCPKHAIQCKLVCKLWCSLVNVNLNNNSYFLRRWRQINYKQANELPTILLAQYQPRVRRNGGIRFEERLVTDDGNYKGGLTFNLNFLPCRRPIRILSAYKDLLLCCPYDLEDDSCYYICNPFTKQWTALPPPPLSTNRGIKFATRAVIIVFDDSDHNDNDFNFTLLVLRVNSLREKNVQIFSSSDNGGRWRDVEYNDECKDMFLYNLGEVSYNGMLVSLVIKYDGTTPSLFGLKFDLNANCTPLPLPLPLEYETSYMEKLGVSQGRLRLAQVYGMKLMDWKFDSSRNEWDKVQEIDLNQVVDHSALGNRLEIFTAWRVLALHPHDENVLYLLYVSRSNKRRSYIFLCNLKEKRVELIREIGDFEQLRLFPLELPCWPTPRVPLLNPNAII